MDAIKLKARFRDGRGKSYTRKTRVTGWIPAVYYGEGMESKSIEVDEKEFAAIVRTKCTSHLIELDLPGEGECSSVIKEIQNHPIKTMEFWHVDFQHVDKNHKVTVSVALKLVGDCKGVKADGGILSQPVHAVNVECLPAMIPDHIEVNVAELRVGQSIHLRDINMPNLTFKDSEDEVIAMVVVPKVDPAAVAAAAAAEAEAAAAAPAKGGKKK